MVAGRKKIGLAASGQIRALPDLAQPDPDRAALRYLDLADFAKVKKQITPRMPACSGQAGPPRDGDIFPRRSAPPPPAPTPAVGAGFVPGMSMVVLEDGVDAVVIRSAGPGRVLVGFDDDACEVPETRYLRPKGRLATRGGS